MNPEAEALGVKLAGAKQSCPTGQPYPVEGVYVLPDSVRVPCNHHEPSEMMPWGDEIRCLNCAGRGWTPSPDFVTWCWALQTVGAAAMSIAIIDDCVESDIMWLHGKEPNWARDAERLLTLLAQEGRA